MRACAIILLLLISHGLEAQTVSDSIIKIYSQENDTTKARKYIDAAAAIQNKDYSNCTRLCDEAIRLSRPLGRTDLIAECYFLKGLTSYFAGEYDATLQFYLLAIGQFDSLDRHGDEARVYNELGIFYRRQQNDSAALNSFKEAYRLGEKSKNEGAMGTAVNNQGMLAQDKGDHTAALDFFQQARNIYTRLQDSIGISYTFDYASVSYAAQGLYSQADQFQKEALEIRLRLKDSNAAALSLINLAEYARLQKNNDEAEKYLFQCLSITEKIKYKDLTAYCYELLSTIYQEKGIYQKAYEYHVKYATLNNEIFNEKRSRQISDLQTKYETEKRIQQIALLKQDNELKDASSRNQRNIFLGILLLVIVSGLSGYFYFRSKKQKEKDEAIIEEKELRSKAIIEAEEKERMRIARDLHDGVAQTMSAAKMQLEFFMGEKNDSPGGAAALKNAFDLVADAAKEVRMVSHSMVPNALLKSGLVAAVRDFVNRMGNEKLKINLVVLGLNERLPENTETIIFRVLQELINNIIKHAQATGITIQLIRKDNLFTLMVEDNGVGFDLKSAAHKEGIGLKNITSRVEYLNGTTHFDSSPGNGTTVIVEIPV